MSFGAFARPVGAQADVKELQYIAALHQTCLPNLREDATVSSIDISRFLKSRFGLDVPHRYALEIVRGLGGGLLGDEVIQHILEETAAGATNDGNAKQGLLAAGAKNVGLAASTLKQKVLRSKKQSEQDEEEPQMEVQAEEPQEEASEEVLQDDLLLEDEDYEGQPEEYLDLVQVLSIILMPTLARAGKEWKDLQEGYEEPEEPQEEEEVDSSFWTNNPYTRYRARARARKEQHLHDLQESLRPKPPSLLQDLFHMMQGTLGGKDSLAETNEDGNYIMNSNLVKQLLQTYDEYERAMDTNLIDKMVQVASSPDGTFTEEGFIMALTSDLSEWEVGAEDCVTPTFYDVWGYGSLREKKSNEEEDADAALSNKEDSEEEEEDQDVENGPSKEQEAQLEQTEDGGTGHDPDQQQHEEQFKKYQVRIPIVGASIDMAVDLHFSIIIVVVIWAFYIATALVYAVLFQDVPALQTTCDKKGFGCQLVDTVWVWLSLAIILSVCGLVMMIPLSLGNGIVRRGPRTVAFAFFMAGVYTFIPFLCVDKLRREAQEPYSDAEKTILDRNYDRSQRVAYGLGMFLMVLFIWQFIGALIGRRGVRTSQWPLVKKAFTPSNTRGSGRTKKAATRKVNDMLSHAHMLHPAPDGSTSVRTSLRSQSSTDETMLNFVLRGQKETDCGGLFWTWKRIWSGRLFDTDGVWINTRLILIQVMQFIFALFYSTILFYGTTYVADQAETASNELNKRKELDIGKLIPDWVYQLVPTRNQVYSALYPADGVAILVMITLILLYIPSLVSTTLKYRSGFNATYTSRLFKSYRTNADTVYLNTGNALYGMLGSATLFWAITALVIFLFVWEFSRDFAILLVAWGLGLTITIVLKMILTKTCRKQYYAAYYRTNPLGANVSLLALECWNIGLGGGVLIGRITQFLIAACFWVGRIDQRFLSEDVNVVGYGFDYVPFNFEKDLLGHDAHRHPYLDRLGAMYMMKLKHGDKFGTDAGSCWRQLFVQALMPWMMKHRVFSDARLADSLELYNQKRLDREKAQEDRNKRVLVKIGDAGKDFVDEMKTGGQGELLDK